MTAEHFDQFITARSALDRKTVENQLILLRAMLNVAHELRWIDRVPKGPKVCRTWRGGEFHYLEHAEDVQRFLRAADEDENPIAHPLYATAIFTGMRAGELAGLEWKDIDLDGRMNTVRRSFSHPTETEFIRYLPILDPLLPILRAWRASSSL